MINYSSHRGLLGKRLREAREKANLTQVELVEKLGKKTNTAISEYEKGKRSFSADELIEFSEALNVPITFFFQDTLNAEDDLETQLLTWFRSLPSSEARRRTFVFLEQMKPLIIGEETTYKVKSKRKG